LLDLTDEDLTIDLALTNFKAKKARKLRHAGHGCLLLFPGQGLNWSAR
jgi:hypothetical protein